MSIFGTDHNRRKCNVLFLLFQMMVRVDTAPTGPGGSIEVAWVGASFGVLPRSGKFYAMNYRISLNQGEVHARNRDPFGVSHSTSHLADRIFYGDLSFAM